MGPLAGGLAGPHWKELQILGFTAMGPLATLPISPLGMSFLLGFAVRGSP
jgi:hypothetical protein